jgi:hypothetical protein
MQWLEIWRWLTAFFSFTFSFSILCRSVRISGTRTCKDFMPLESFKLVLLMCGLNSKPPSSNARLVFWSFTIALVIKRYSHFLN